MKTKEFIRRVEELRLDCYEKSEVIVIGNEPRLASVDKEYTNVFDTSYKRFTKLDKETQRKLFNLLVEYASTPIEERKEEKKYYIKHKYLGTYYKYLNYDTADSSWAFNDAEETYCFKTQFTLAELPLWAKEMLEQGHLVKEEVE